MQRCAAFGRHTVVICGALFVTAFHAVTKAEEADSTLLLQEVTVSAPTQAGARVASDGSMTVNEAQLRTTTRFFGEADMLRLLNSHAGTAASSDYSSGLNIDGMGNMANAYTINGVPVHFPYHFGGIFSVFNARQYPRLTLLRSIRGAGNILVLGGVVDMKTRTLHPDTLSAMANMGLLASSAAVAIPLGKRWSVAVSGRVSYVDALYHELLSSDDTDVRYNFYDYDASLTYNLSTESTLQAFAHFNKDKLKYDDMNYGLNTFLSWRNALGGICWNAPNASATVYYTEMVNRLQFKMQNINIQSPSIVKQAGATGHVEMEVERVRVSGGARADYYYTNPQEIMASGIGRPVSASESTMSLNSSVWVSGVWHSTPWLDVQLDAEANGLYSLDEDYHVTNIDPRLMLRFRLGSGSLCLHAGRYHQYLHLVGFSEIGLPSNFKILSSSRLKPQEALNFAAGYATELPFGGIRLNTDLYYKRIFHASEYFGSVLDLLSSDYRPINYITSCNGYNCGGTVGLSREWSGLSLSANYGYGIARRRMPGNDSYFRAASEARHTFNAMGAYTFRGGHWTVNTSFSYMSGRPISPVKAVYIIGQSVVVEYGKRNSSSLPAYHRLDVGGSYSFTTRKVHHTVSLSLINAYGHRNIELINYKFDDDRGMIKKKYHASLYRFLPSLSYTIEL